MRRIIKGLSYAFYRNLGWKDRLARAISAFVIMALWLSGVITGVVGVTLGILALMILATAAISRCSITYMLKANTMSEQEKAKLAAKGIKYEVTND